MLSALAGGLLGTRHGAPPARVVALHGWRRSSADFDQVLEGTAAIAPDLPGFGASAPPDSGWGSAEYAEAIRPVCEEDGPVTLVGHSFGGRVAVMLAATYPTLVSGIVLTGTPLWRPAGGGAPRAPLGFRIAKQLHRFGVLSERAMEAQRQRWGSDDYRAATGVMRAVLVRAINETNDGTYRRAVDAIRCPVELVWGRDDSAAPVAVAEEAQHVMPGASLTVLDGVGHLTPTLAPDAIRAAIGRLG